MVFYRKYRPQTIDELDSKHVRETLTAVLSAKDPAHAFLFTGPKGLGKTSTARIVAKAVNCEKRAEGKGQRAKSVEPCNQCNQCVSITNGNNVDIIEIDGASNRNIDDVRDLKEKITLSPASAKRKVYIIDEVHMFTTESFNALLKTLEEPPAHAMFILCTTERHKVPATIVSRCFTIDFQPATQEELIRSFKRIAKGEELKIPGDTLEMIVQLADGGFRDGAKILEELAGLATDKTITKELIESKFKVASSKHHVASMIESLAKRDVSAGLKIIQEAVEQGIDMKSFLFQLLEALHGELLQKAGVMDSSKFKEQNSRPKDDLVQRHDRSAGSKPLAEELTMEDMKVLIELLSKSYGDMKHAVLPQLPLELAIIEWTTFEKSDSIRVIPAKERTDPAIAGEGARLLDRGGGIQETSGSPIKSGMTNNKIDTGGVTVAGMRKQMGNLARVKALYGEPKVVKTKVDGDDSAMPKIDLTQIANDEITVEWLQTFWTTFIAEMKQHNHTIAGVLRGCSIRGFDKKTLIIETAYKFHKERLDEGKNREALEAVCKILTGNPVTVEVVLRR